MTGLNVTKLTANVGAVISGVDLTEIDSGEFELIRSALFDHGVIFFRDQALSPEQHIAFAERFGPIDVNRFFTPVKDYPQIAEVRTEAHQNKVIGGSWHSDHTYDPVPAMCSILVARDVPEFGGDTMFASSAAAYDALSDGLRECLERMDAWHSDGSFIEDKDDDRIDESAITRPNSHPVVIRHPQTGRKSVYVNGGFTTHFVGWTEEESAPLLRYLYDFIPRPERSCRFTWQNGSVAVWDNRLVQHLAVGDYFGQHRLMHRVTVAGQSLSR